jgi:hypothetical protein
MSCLRLSHYHYHFITIIIWIIIILTTTTTTTIIITYTCHNTSYTYTYTTYCTHDFCFTTTPPSYTVPAARKLELDITWQWINFKHNGGGGIKRDCFYHHKKTLKIYHMKNSHRACWHLMTMMNRNFPC